MIDKNDVKMPVQKESTEDLTEERVRLIEELLDRVNEVENKQELRLKADYYGKFNWFGFNIAEKEKKSYFSYQEEAVYDFVFTLNKSGILSDQVGMGKTIEAGMIISELAGRNELRSLLIVVPNEIMAKKWEYELENKFGIKRTIRDNQGVTEIYPDVKVIKNFDDFSKSVYDCVASEKFAKLANALQKKEFSHSYDSAKKGVTMADVIKTFILSDIEKAVTLINDGFELNEMEGDPRILFDGKNFEIEGKGFVRKYEYDANRKISAFLKSNSRRDDIAGIINNRRFNNRYHEFLELELRSLFTLIGHYISTLPEEITKITTNMTSGSNYPILVIPISYAEQIGERTVQREFLNRKLLQEIKDYKHMYITQDSHGQIKEVHEDYRIIDFFIDAGYQTLIVDEVHDYIDVCAKVNRENYHNGKLYSTYPSDIYNRYELFDDYYFIKKNSLYKKLKNLADKANRKIFLTATPIKSDMIDFYLLTLLASNKDSDAYKKASESLMLDFPIEKKREAVIFDLYNSFKECINANDGVVEDLCENSSVYFKRENEVSVGEGKPARLVYPYFNNDFLSNNIHNPKLIREYLLSHMSYLTMEEIVLELILSFKAENAERGIRETDMKKTVADLKNLLDDTESRMQTKVVFRSLLNNTVKLRFEEDFTRYDEHGKKLAPIKRIRELLELEDGPRKWHKTYRKYGIRHTRHQTYNLAECDLLDNFGDVKKERYKNLPIWPQRDGKVIFLLRDDVFFDSFLEVKRERKILNNEEIKKEDLPNFEKLKGSEVEKQKKFDNAVAIFDFINNSMSGGDIVNHEPQNSKYESIELDDSHIVDYKLALVNKLMLGKDSALGSVNRKVLLFAENNREEIIEWFRYQKCAPIYDENQPLDPVKAEDYKKRWLSYTVEPVNEGWRVSEDTEHLQTTEGNLLVIIDPKRYEKGVDLQKADTIINFDINYCPLKMEQRIGRIDRIRPAGQEQKINIISFVPLNDMSGYVINFFANELKMFTQWMGETTGIVSVPEDANAVKGGEDVSFEGKVSSLERLYKHIYRLCREDVNGEEISKMAEEFKKFFASEKVDGTAASIDFGFINKMRASFDKAFQNSLSPERQGYIVKGTDKRVMRFNSTMGALEVVCAAENCANCPNLSSCNNDTKEKRNKFSELKEAVQEFFSKGEEYYATEAQSLRDRLYGEKITSAGNLTGNALLEELNKRKSEFETKGKIIMNYLSAFKSETNSFTVDFDAFSKEVSLPMKALYWDGVVNKYINLILNRFHNQCDSVLQSAKLFEKFIKTLSIADFMNNMEGK